MNKLKPVNDKIVVKTNSKEEEVTEGGILLPDTVDQGKLMEGEVVAVGNGMYSASGTLIPVVVDVGDKILYNKHAQLHEYDDDLVIMSVNEILSIVEEVG
jgi:chaperonin GroES